MYKHSSYSILAASRFVDEHLCKKKNKTKNTKKFLAAIVENMTIARASPVNDRAGLDCVDNNFWSVPDRCWPDASSEQVYRHTEG